MRRSCYFVFGLLLAIQLAGTQAIAAEDEYPVPPEGDTEEYYPDGGSTGISTLSAGTLAVPYAAGPVGPLLGTLTIANGATLVMANQAPNPPAGANVNTFNLNTGGTLWMQFAASPTAPTPYINANTANLAGRLVVDLATTNGLYQNSYSYQDIIDANTRNGTFSSVVMARPSALLTPVAFTKGTDFKPARRPDPMSIIHVDGW